MFPQRGRPRGISNLPERFRRWSQGFPRSVWMCSSIRHQIAYSYFLPASGWTLTNAERRSLECETTACLAVFCFVLLSFCVCFGLLFVDHLPDCDFVFTLGVVFLFMPPWGHVKILQLISDEFPQTLFQPPSPMLLNPIARSQSPDLVESPPGGPVRPAPACDWPPSVKSRALWP